MSKSTPQLRLPFGHSTSSLSDSSSEVDQVPQVSRSHETDTRKYPELSVITNFSKPSTTTSTSTILHRRQRSREKGAVERLKAHTSELSPSDRDLLICIEGVESHGTHQKQGLVVERDMSTEPKSATANPEIVVTPAGLEVPWQSQGRRPTSSMYSRATHIARGSPNPQAPPVPEIPQYLKDDKTESRVTSWAETEEEFTSRPASRESQTGILRNADPITTPRSEGWWNTIVTPFLNRNDSSKTIQWGTPKLPRFRSTRDKNRETGRTSVWFDKSRDTLAFFRDNDSEGSPVPPMPTPVISPEYEEPKPLGEAAEYYEASYHDLNSTEPYYKCQNHMCSYGSSNFQRHVMITSPMDEGVTEKNLRTLDSSHASGHDNLSLHSMHDDSDDGKRAIGTGVAGLVGAGGLASLDRSAEPSQANKALSKDGDSLVEGQARKVASPKTELSEAPTDSDKPANSPKVSRGLSGESKHVYPAVLPPPPPPPVQNSVDRRPAFVVAPDPEPSLFVPQSPPATFLPPPAAHTKSPAFTVPSQASPPPAIASPGPMTPGLRAEVARNNAIPMQTPAPVFLPPPVEQATFGPPKEQATFGPPQEQATFGPLASSRGGRESLGPGGYGGHGGFGMMTSNRGSPSLKNTSSSEALGSHPTFGATYPGQSRDLTPLPNQQVHLHQNFGPGTPETQWQSHNEGLYYPPTFNQNSQQSRAGSVCEKAEPKGPGALSRIGGLFKKLWSLKPKKDRTVDQKKRRRWFWIVFAALLAMVILIIVLVLTITTGRTDMPIETSWLNLTNYPPIPTGISTIAQPNAEREDGCVSPKTMWSCAVPKEEQEAIKPNAPNQPNFRLEIRFHNGTNLTNSSDFTKRSDSPGLTVRHLFKHIVKRDFTDSLFNPSPEPPSLEEQEFLGNTTDGNQGPFAGEDTPFYISFLPADKVSKAKRSLSTRQNEDSDSDSKPSPTSNDTSDTNTTFPSLSTLIPAPATDSDGRAALANLLPFPSAQPLKLYNRDEADEHYGFYIYYDRSIFLKSASIDNITEIGEIPADENGGSDREAASVRCTWPQTRFLVQIWTKAEGAATLLGNGTTDKNGESDSQDVADSSANDFSQPGSFPYPVTITLDRHGGEVTKKNAYCYGMDNRGFILEEKKKLQLENRAFGGELINPSLGVFDRLNITKEEGGPGGIDGGTGGCSCVWKNFE